MDERLYYLGFSLFPGIGPRRFQKLLAHFGSAEKAWNAPVRDLEPILGKTCALKLDAFRAQFLFKEYVSELKRKDVSFLILTDKEYPQLLKSTKKPPFVLYVRGSVQNDTSVAVVGTRKITQYGRDVTELFVQELVKSGCAIVSGLALGVDAAAHKRTIENGGKTIAVLGCGVDCCYPGENQWLYEDILKKGGAIVSEVPLGLRPSRGLFPARNRIIAGLSQAVVVTEGGEDSGALITAREAFEMGRPVFAVPGPITSELSKGPYELIRKGAVLATSPHDLLNELGIMNQEERKKKKRIRGETKEEDAILRILVNEPLYFDQIVRKTQMDSSVVGATLSLMEIKGMIHNINGLISLGV